MGDQISQEFLFRHVRGLAAQLFHAHCGLEVAQTQFQSPAPGIESHEFLGGIALGIQQGGHQGDAAAAEAPDRGGEANNAHGDLRGQPFPLGGG